MSFNRTNGVEHLLPWHKAYNCSIVEKSVNKRFDYAPARADQGFWKFISVRRNKHCAVMRIRSGIV